MGLILLGAFECGIEFIWRNNPRLLTAINYRKYISREIMSLDIAIAVGLVALTAIMGYLGVHVTLHAQTDPRKIRLFKAGFVLCAVAMAALIVWQTVRATNQQRENAALLARIEKNTEHPPNVNIENKIDTKPLADLFRPGQPNGQATAKSSAAPKESPNSLRRRTLKLCAELDAFWQKRQEVWQQSPKRQDDATNQQYKEWSAETQNLYMTSDLRQRTLEIVRQLELKGLDVGYIGMEYGAAKRVPMPDEIAHLRDLAHYLDANDNVVHIP